MRLLLDTHVLLWAASSPQRLPLSLRRELEDEATQPMFSAISLWEVGIKAGLGRSDFAADAAVLRRGMLDNGYEELPFTSEHAVAVAALPVLHKDPFDRALIAQAIVEGAALVTADAQLPAYPAPIRRLA
jgi:PIN domain nuclease of toxin-antitoxin system